MLKKTSVLIILGIIGLIFSPGWNRSSSAQGDLSAYKGNNCVTCHSKDNVAIRSFARYAEWTLSSHKDKGVGCDKCHGGDPAAKDQKIAHTGMLAPAEAQSRLHLKNLPETCGACHQAVVKAFAESKHSLKLKDSGIGPSCTTCHAHMATTVLYTPKETAALCSQCHDSDQRLMPRRPEIPAKADEVMQSIRRATTVVLWADRLLEEGRNKKVDIKAEEKEMETVRVMFTEAKASWHAFDLEAVQKKADATFESATKLKDELRKKLYP